jgi:chromosomal replication initiator protein
VNPDLPQVAAIDAPLPREDVAPVTSTAVVAVEPPTISDTFLHSDYTFDNFIVGGSNHFAHAASIAVAEARGQRYNPFFLHGAVGLGKTHLLQAICHEILRRDPRAKITYLSCEAFTNHFIQAVEEGDLTSFRHKYRNVDVLLVDDIQTLRNKDRTQEEFFHTFNTLYNLGRQIVLTSDAPPKEIPDLQERLISRFQMGLVVELTRPDFETRVAILKRKARMRGKELPDDVALMLADRIETNIRELEGAVVRLVSYASLVDKPITVALAEEVLRGTASARTSAITISDIIEVVAAYYDVKVSDLQGKRRSQSIVFPRQVCMFLARSITKMSLNDIGGYFGGRDHTTVLYAIDKIAREAKNNDETGEVLRRLTRSINGR